MADEDALYPLEFFVAATPMSLQGSNKSKERWKAAVRNAASIRIGQKESLWYMDRRPLAVTIYYFLAGPMAGDVDNIVKPIMDALNRVAYMSDNDVERVVVQKFEPQANCEFVAPSDYLAAAMKIVAPVVYVRVDDDLGWRRLD